MKLTYKGETVFPKNIQFHLLFFTFTIDSAGEKVTGAWIGLIFFFAFINGFILWPWALMWAANHLGAHLEYSFKTFGAGFLFYYVLTKRD